MTQAGRFPLHVKVLTGLVLGAIAGAIAQNSVPAEALTAWTNNLFKPLGTIFLNMIFMVVVPLLFAALVLGTAELGQARKFGRIGVRALIMTIALSGIAVVLGLVLVNTFKPGAGISAEQRASLEATYAKKEDADKKVEQAGKAATVADTITDLVPKNPLESAVKALEGGLLPFMVFALFFGIALSAIEPEKGQPVKQFLEGLFAVSQKVIEYAMRFAPIGVFGFAFVAASTLGVDAFLALGKYALLVLVGLAIQLFVVYPIFLKLVARRNPVEFFRQMKTVMMTAFATSSSNATLPYALKAAEEEVGLPRNISSFVLTFGATANQNGTALFEGITLIFLAQFYGVSLDLGQQVTVMLLSIVAGIGTAGVPGGAWPMIAIILIKIGVPPQAIGICLGIDRILDMSRTVLNVTGDMTIATCVAAMEERSDRNLAPA